MPKKDISLQNQELLGQLSAKVDMLLEESKTIGIAVYGNGDPMQGLAATMVRVESQLQQAAGVCDANAKSLGVLSDAVRSLTSSVDQHHKTFHISRVLGNWKFYPAVLATYLILHNLANLVGRPVLAWLLLLLKIPVPGWLQ